MSGKKRVKRKGKEGGKDQGNLHEQKLTIQYKIFNSNKAKENDFKKNKSYKWLI